MKRILFLLVLACGLKADQLIDLQGLASSGLASPCVGIPLAADSVTTALNSSSTTVRSSTIDTAGWLGIFVKVTSNGSARVEMEFSNTPTAATWQRGYTLVSNGDAPLRTLNRYIRFRNATSLTYTAVTVSYLPCNTSASQAITASISGVVPVDARGSSVVASIGAGPLFAANTPGYVSQVADTSMIGFVDLSSTAYTGLTTNATVTLNVTATAGSASYRAYLVYAKAETGVTSIRYVTHNGTTVPGSFGASNGFELFPSDRWTPIGYWTSAQSNSPHFSLRASALSGATSGSIFFVIKGQP